MKCKYPMTKRDHTNRVWHEFGCGKCLPCRLKKRASWALRCQLEAQQSATRSFWTLTLKEDCLQVASEEHRRQTVKNFFNALRMSELRAGNRLPIRYYGCLEFGGQFARPHWHFLIFNLVKNYREPLKYRRGMPLPRLHMPQWPHGHVSVAEFNTATVNYVTDYMTDFMHLKQADPSLAPVPYRTIRPAIGYYGVKRAAHIHAKQRGIISEMPAYFSIRGRKYPLDQWTRDKFKKYFLQLGGQIRPEGSPHTRWAMRLIEENEIEAATPKYVEAQEKKYEDEQLRKAAKKKEAQRQKELRVSDRYQKRKAAQNKNCDRQAINQDRQQSNAS